MTISDSSTHAIPRFAHAVDAALDRVAESSALFMSPSEKVDALTVLARVENRITALRLRVMASAGDACEAGAHRTVADLAATVSGEDRKTCARDLRLAEALERFRLVAEAMRAGFVSEAKARIITRALADLDADPEVSRGLVDRAEQHLVAEAVEFRPTELEALANKILQTIAPWIERTRTPTVGGGRTTRPTQNQPATDHLPGRTPRCHRDQGSYPDCGRGTVADLSGGVHRTPPPHQQQ